MTNSNEAHERWELQDENGRNSASGNYVNVYNYISGYSTFTGYGSILKSLLGKEDCFYAEYISSVDIFKKFDEEYADIVQEVWGIDPKKITSIQCIYMDFHDLVNGKFYDEGIMLKLDEFFSKKKIDKIISQSNGNLSQAFSEKTLKEIEQFQTRLTTNDDPQKRNALAHNIVYNNIKTRINKLNLQNSEPLIGENKENVSQPQIQQEVQQTQDSIDSPKMKFIKGFIQAYNDTEDEYQYQKRANDDLMDVKRLQEIIDTKGMNRMLTVDLDGKWIGTPGEEGFKVQYSQKQVSAMARLLKIAQLLTESKKLNPEGRNYLEEFTSLPDIEHKLKEMKSDLQDENSYMFELREKAKSNREGGNLPSYPPTPAELEALDTPSSAFYQGQKQDMGVSQAQAEKIDKEKKLEGEAIISAVKQKKITTSETQKSTHVIADINEIKRLQFKRQSGGQLTEEEQRKVEEYEKQRAQIINNSKKQHNIQGMSFGM